MSVTIDSHGWIKEAIEVDYPEKSFGPFLQAVQFIVLHGTASPGASAQNIANNWANNPGEASVHVLINKDGSFVQGLSLNDTAWGNGNNTGNAPYLPPGNPNHYTISIEHCKDDARYNSDILTPEQQAASFELCIAISAYHMIPLQVVTIGDVGSGGTIRHADIDPQNRQFCPGPYPFAALQAFYNGGDMNLFIGPHANDTRVQLWNSFSVGIGKAPPQQGLGLFHGWIEELNNGVNRGSPFGGEYDLTLGSGKIVRAQGFPGGVQIWHQDTGRTEWI